MDEETWMKVYVLSAAAVISGLVCIVNAYKRLIKFKMEEWKYDLRVQDIGFWAMLDDNKNKKRNILTEVPDVTGKIAVVTGGARGIGYHVVKKLTELGMKVVLGVRKVEAGNKIAKEFKDLGLTGSIDVYQLDTSSVKSVESFANTVSKEYPNINLLVNNAGIMFGDYSVTEDGFESQLATNYLGHFLLTHLLMPNLKAAGEKSDSCSRVVNVSSCAHKASSKIIFDDINFKKKYFSSAAYAQSKLAQIMAARHMDGLLQAQGSKVHCYSVHPGVVDTDLFEGTSMKRYSQWFMNLFFKRPEEGAISILHTCLSPRLETEGGAYISNCRKGSDSDCSRNKKDQEKLFKITCDMLKVKDFGV